jgi:RNA polymerase sigma factor (TIGR02999 family)
MRQILIDSARKRLAKKRGGEAVKVSLEEGLAVSDEGLSKVLIIDEVLSALEKRDPRQARVVEMRFYVGLDFAEIADVLGVSVRTALRDWKAAQAWLYAELSQRK